MLSALPAARFDGAAGEAWLRARATARSIGPAAAAALGAVLGYLAETHRASVDHLRPPEGDGAQAVMVIDEASRRNLELLATTRGERRGSLLAVLDETRTPMGGRLLRQWMLAPLTDIAAIGAPARRRRGAGAPAEPPRSPRRAARHDRRPRAPDRAARPRRA